MSTTSSKYILNGVPHSEEGLDEIYQSLAELPAARSHDFPNGWVLTKLCYFYSIGLICDRKRHTKCTQIHDPRVRDAARRYYLGLDNGPTPGNNDCSDNNKPCTTPSGRKTSHRRRTKQKKKERKKKEREEREKEVSTILPSFPSSYSVFNPPIWQVICVGNRISNQRKTNQKRAMLTTEKGAIIIVEAKPLGRRRQSGLVRAPRPEI